MKLGKYPKELNSGFDKYFKNKFRDPDSVNYNAEFTINGNGNLRFFAKLKFPSRPNI